MRHQVSASILRGTLVLLVLVGCDLLQADTPAETVSELLDQWSQNTTSATLDVKLMTRELDSEGKWRSAEPIPGRFRFDRAAGIARLDRLTSPARTYLIDGSTLITREQGKPDQSAPLGPNESLATRLWIDSLPAFLLVGVDPKVLRRDFEIKSLRSSEKEIQLFMYPQTRAAREKYQRLEIRLSTEAKIAVEIHIVWKDNSHTFWAVIEPQTDLAIDADSLKAK